MNRENRAIRVITQTPSFRLGYRKGRDQGYAVGYQNGTAKGFADVMAVFSAMGRALIITPSFELPSLEIMLLQPFRAMAEQRLHRFTAKTEDTVTRADIESHDSIIFLRSVEPQAFEWMQLANDLGKKTIYCIDDNFLEIPEDTDVTSYYRDSARRETFVKFLSSARIVKMDSPYFADYIKQSFNPRVVYFPSSVDFDWIDQSQKPIRTDGLVVIGYEGTPKNEDFAPVIPALLSVLREYGGRVRLHFHGFVPGGLERHPWVAHFPIEKDYRTFMHSLNQKSWDIGIAPLSDSVFNFCKTNNKFREYSACAIPGIYSEAPAYRECVIQGETGLMVPHTTEGWYAGLRQMIDDPELRNRVKAQAGAIARQQYSIQNSVECWLNLILRV